MLRTALAILAALLLLSVAANQSTAATSARGRTNDRAFMCIHHYEGGWHANTGNGYYGGLQMDKTFMLTYGRWAVRRWGWANNWPIRVQLDVAEQAHDSGRGFYPWPNTARRCGLI